MVNELVVVGETVDHQKIDVVGESVVLVLHVVVNEVELVTGVV